MAEITKQLSEDLMQMIVSLIINQVFTTVKTKSFNMHEIWSRNIEKLHKKCKNISILSTALYTKICQVNHWSSKS